MRFQVYQPPRLTARNRQEYRRERRRTVMAPGRDLQYDSPTGELVQVPRSEHRAETLADLPIWVNLEPGVYAGIGPF